MTFATNDQIRAMTGLTTNDVSDSVLNSLGTFAATQLLRDINIEYQRERIVHIDNTRQNNIDSSNTTFYVLNWRKYISDTNYDQSVTTSDITVYQVQPEGTEGTVTVSSITPNDGKYVLASAPSPNNDYYVDYSVANVSVSDPDPLISLAYTTLVGAYAYTRVSVEKYQRVRIGAISVTLSKVANKVYMDNYKDITNQINNKLADVKKTIVDIDDLTIKGLL